MPDETWSWREGPLLEVCLREVDKGHTKIGFGELAAETGIEVGQVQVAMRALRDAGYIKAIITAGGGGFVHDVSAEARQRLGTWPSADAAVDRLIAALLAAAEEEPDPERKGRLRAVAEGLAGVGRTVAAETLAAFVRQKTGLP